MRFIIDFCGSPGSVTAPPGFDWKVVAQGLERHGLTRLIPGMIAAPGLVPAGEVAALRKMHFDQTAAALAQVREVVRICTLLEEAGVRFLLIKGLALSVQLDGQPGLRGSKDIDLIVEPDAGPVVDGILRSLEYARPDHARAEHELPGRVGKEVGYLNRERGTMVEVHSRLTENAELYTVDFEMLWREREAVAIGRLSVPTMARHRLTTYLCLHGARHCWARLMWLLDIASLTGSSDAIDAALADARRHRLEPVVLHALSMLHQWFGHEVPPEVLARAQSSRTVRILNRVTALYHSGRYWYVTAPRYSWRRSFQHSLLGRLASYRLKSDPAYWRQQLLLDLASPADRKLVELPPRLAWGYAALRPFGWLIRRLRG